MSPDRSTAAASLSRVVAFAALAALVAAQWSRLVEDPPRGAVALATAGAVAGAAAAALIAARRPAMPRARGPLAVALAAVAILVATGVGMVAVGIPVRLLIPSGWGELGAAIREGFNGIVGEISYPYRGGGWTRVIILAGLPVALGATAALAFWPGRGGAGAGRLRRGAALAILVAAFTTADAVVAPEQPLLWGFLLLAGIVGWRALPTLSARDAVGAAVVVAVAGALAIPFAGALDHDGPWIDFRQWQLGGSDPATFDWNHTYGPIDWPRDGTELAAIESKKPQYWRQAVLEQFDGDRWVRSERSLGRRLELPTQVEGGPAGATLRQPHAEWIRPTQVTIGPLVSKFVLGAGALIAVDGIPGVYARPDGSTLTETPLQSGDNYEAVGYAPDPSPSQLRGAPRRYPGALARYTEVTLPGRPEPAEHRFVAPALPTPVQVPLRGSAAPRRERAARRVLAVSPYATTYALARRLAAGQPTAYGVTQSIQAYLRQGYAYSETPPNHKHPLPAFLFRDKAGYCQQFSGAMALLLRMDGIPARVVAGFSPGTPDPDNKNRYIVADLDAHSWVEAYFPTIGWATFDPTPSASPATGRIDDPGITGLGDTIGSGEVSGTARKEFIPGEGAITDPNPPGNPIPAWTLPAMLLVLALAGIAALAARTVARRLRYRGLSPAERADAHLHELPAALARLGWPLGRADTLLAVERRLRRTRHAAAAAYVAKLRAGRYSAAPAGAPTLAERGAMRDDLSRDDGWRSRIRGWVALPPGGPG